MDSFDIYYIYILANKRNGTLYIGVTNNLLRRVIEHKEKIKNGFPEKYELNMLVYYEEHSSIKGAIAREKALKKWSRIWNQG